MRDCVFCQIGAGLLPAVRVYEDDAVVAVFDRAPVAEYHTLLIPKRHAPDIFGVSDEDARALASAVRTVARLYRGRLGITAVQIVSSNGRAAQQDAMHLHVHLVPRAEGDKQDIVWHHDPGIRDRFDELLARLAAPQP